MADLKELASALTKGDAPAVEKMTREAVEAGTDPKVILDDGLIAGMQVVGERFKNNEIYVPEVLIAARAMHAGMQVLEPLLVKAGIKPVATIAMGTVRGDLHDIGKNLVSMMLRGNGFKVIDLGVDVPPEKFVEAAKGEDVKLIGMSALLTTTMPSMKSTIDELQKADLYGKVRVIIGGAPVTQRYANEIGADGYAPDAASAVDKAKALLGM
ncbi:MAG: corrinoid protein [Candidatus Hydrogenedentota bacterium]|nr:MAG: corrinoid protein [Candidatus Hydrogenedentota bacterium]